VSEAYLAVFTMTAGASGELNPAFGWLIS